MENSPKKIFGQGLALVRHANKKKKDEESGTRLRRRKKRRGPRESSGKPQTVERRSYSIRVFPLDSLRKGKVSGCQSSRK